MFGRRSFRLLLFAAAALILAGRNAVKPFLEAQTNPIVLENAQTGSPSSEWDVSGAGDPSIQGFATDISVNKGDAVSFKVKTDSTNYRIDIYRLGYYGGAGARLVAANLVPSAALPQNQPDCLVNDTGLADCGNWGVSASWSTAGATSGIYLAKLKRLDVGGSSHIVFIVRDDARQADVVVQTSDTTWQAYNQYGGGSLYCGGPNSNAGTVYSCTGRATKVSYNRPFDTRAHDATSFLFNAEYPMVRWLEANGYDVKYISGVDTERRAADLVGGLKPKAFLSVGHDEYWSAGQRASVEAARDAGVHLAFFSGNEMYWKTRWEPSIDGSNTPYRTLVGYKDTLGGVKLDPMPNVTTGTWRDMRFAPPIADGGRPENNLTGQIWTVNSGTSAITVPASMAGLRFWRNTTVAGLTSGSATLGTDTLGYEWDEDLENGFRPAGMIHLSSTTVNGVEKIQDFGESVALGTATHTLTLYRDDSGALVFGAGTVQWSWGLDANHDRGSAPASLAMQQATMNLLADMGAQPGTVQSGLTPSSASADTARPTSAVTTPADGSTVGAGERITVTGTASDTNGIVAGVEVSVDGGTTWRAAQGTSSWSYEWTAGAPGQVTIRTRAIDDSGNVEVAGAGATVTISGTNCPCPSLWSPATVPAVPDVDDPSPVELGLKFRSDVNGYVKGVRFYKSVNNTGTHIGSLWPITGGTTPLASAVFTNETPSGWQEVLFDVPVAVTANTTYVVSYHTNIGHYAATGAYFSTLGVDRAPLHALSTAAGGGNGVFGYGASQFPTSTFNATNYWVDVVFDSTPDTTPPAIGDVSATPIDGSTARVTWTTDEPATSSVDYSTDSTFFAPATQTVSDAAYVTAHSMRLTGLRPNTAYFFRVRSVDRAGNVAAKPPTGPTPPPAPGQTPPPVQGFTMPSPMLHDTASADFNAGMSSGTYVAESEDGELTLAPARGSEFSGSTMPAGWATRIWSDGGSALVGGGRLTVDGARVATCVDGSGVCQEQYDLVPGTSLEFVATFTGDPYQHSGLGQTLESSFEPMALFSTSWTDADGVFQSGSSLGVRTYDGFGGNGETRTTLGPGLLNAPHRYRIDWLAAEVVYSVDGLEVARHAVAVAGPMRPVAASDFNAFSGKVVVDWVRNTPYVASGSFLSRVFDGTTAINWDNVSWVADTPEGTTIAIGIRTGDTPTPDDSWTPFAAVSPGPLSRQSRYIQYRAELATSAATKTPAIADVRIAGAAPPAPVPVITPEIVWSVPAAIDYGTALSVTQLNAATTPEVEGTFAYNPPAGTVLPAGDHTLSVTFTPTDTAHYTSANGTVTLRVNKATPVISWSAPAAITYGAALGAAQLNATANVAGGFVYTPAAGTVLGGGDQTLSVAFTPNDSSNYGPATASVSITVQRATPVITWPTPTSITYGTPLGASQLNASADVPGSFVYTPPAGTVLPAGAGQVLSAAFTPANTANYNNVSATVAITVVKPTGTVTVSSSNSPSLFGVPVTLTATVVPASATGSVTFKDATTTIGTAAVNGGAATITTASLAVGTHSITAIYGGDSAVFGATSAAFSQVISPSAKVAVSFMVYALQDTSKNPKVQIVPVPNGLVKVFSTSNSCVGGLLSSLNSKRWGQIFDGLDGVGGADGCTPISVGSYEATGTTNTAGAATIVVPPLDFNYQTQYIVIGRATNFDYVKTATATDPLYSAYPILMVSANTTRSVPLSMLATFEGKIVPGAQTEFFGSYLNIIQPEYMEWTENEEKYPFVMTAQGGWQLTTSVTPPEGFVPDAPALSAAVADTTTAVQFTMTDVGSDWTATAVNHSIVHNGATTAAASSIPMIDKKATTARNDSRKVMHDSSATMLDPMVNDKVNHLRTPLRITGTTPALNGAVVVTDDGLNVSYTPTPGYSGVDSFTYTITDAIGDSSTGTVTVTVLATPAVSVKNVTAVEGDSGTTAASVNIVLSNQSLDTVTVTYQTVDGTAAAGADYEAASGTVTFAPLVTSMPITVQVMGDTKAEFNEKLSVKISNPTNATIAAVPGGDVTIIDDDPPEASIAATASITEGNTGSNNVAVNVTLSQSHAESVWVNYATSDGTAVAGSDYLKTTGTLQFYPGTVTKTIYVPVLGDTVGEKTELFYVDISAPLNATLTDTRATVSIVNDDAASQVFTSAADFGAGTVGAGAYVSDTSGGEIMLAPAQADEFSGGTLPLTWSVEALGAGGSTALASGKLVADGAAVLGTLTGSGKTLEFAATFTGRPDQAIGFSASSTPASPMAMFVIGADRQLYARTIYGAKWFEQQMAGVDWLGKSLRYQITWNSGSAQYYINGTLMITHSNMAWGTVMMRPAIVDTAVGDGGLTVDYMRMTPYAASGTYTSAVFDAGDSVTWVKLTTTSTVPSVTTSTITYRTGSTPVPDDTWTPFTALGTGGVMTGTSRYLQYAIQMSTTAVAKTPLVQDVTVQYKK
jgi:hypothetical protein